MLILHVKSVVTEPAKQNMDLVEGNEQNRKDFNIMGKKILYLEEQNFTVRKAKIYAHLLSECRSTCLRAAAVSNVIKLLQAGDF